MDKHESHSKMASVINKVTYMKAYKCNHCNRCYSLYVQNGNITGRVPLLLPCSHSICEECVLSFLKTKSVSCRVCHCEVTVSDKILDIRELFPVDRYVFSLLMNDGNKNIRTFPDMKVCVPYQPAGVNFQPQKKSTPEISSTAKEMCSQRQSCAKVAELRCIECGEIYCTDCDKTIHEKLRILKLHIRLPISVADLSDFYAPCKMHADTIAEYYCNTCEEMLCSVCLIKTHKGDDFISLSEKNTIHLPDLKLAMRKAKRVLKVLEISEENVKETYKDTRQTLKPADLECEIKRHFAHVHSRLQLLEAHMLQQLHQLQNRDTEVLADIAKQLDENKKRINSYIATGSLLAKGDFLNKVDVNELTRKLIESLNVPCALTKSKLVGINDVKFVVDVDIVNSLNEHCDLKCDLNNKHELVPLSEEQLDDIDAEFTDDEAFSNTVSLSGPSSVSSSSSRLAEYCYSESECKTRVSLSGAPPDISLPAKNPDSESNDQTLVADTYENVIVTHLEDPLHFYVQLSKKKKHIEFFTEKYKKYVENASTPKSPEIGAKYIVQYKSENFSNWYRAIVEEIIDTEDGLLYEVFYIDYGNTARVPLSMIKNMKGLFAKDPPYAHKCRIADITPKNNDFGKDVKKYVISFITGSSVLKMHIIKKHKDILDVDLICEQESLQAALAFVGYVDIKPKMDTSSKPSSLVLQQKKIMTGIKNYRKDETYDVFISNIESPQCIYVQKMDNKKLIRDLETTMTKFYKSDKSKNLIYTPQKGLLCAAQLSFNEHWIRVEIIDLPGFAMVEVFSVDHGICETVAWDQLRKLKDNFMQTDSQAIKISLQDIAPNEDLGKDWLTLATCFLNDYVKNKYIKMYVNNCSTNQLNATLYEITSTVDICINALLVKQGLARSTGENSAIVEYYKVIPDEVDNPATDTSHENDETYSNVGDPEEDTTTVFNSAYYRAVQVITVESPSCFYVTLPEWVDLKNRLTRRLKRFYSNETSPNCPWSVNAKCVVLSSKDKSFYRAIVTEVLDEENYEVFLKDIVRSERVSKENMYNLDKNFTSYEDLSIKCFLAGCQPAGDAKKWSNSARDYFQELVTKYPQLYITKQGNIVNKTVPVNLVAKWEESNGPLKPSTVKTVILNKCLIERGLALPDKSETLKNDNASEIEHTSFSNENTPHNDSVLTSLSTEPKSRAQTWMPANRLPTKKFKCFITYVDADGHIYLQTEHERRAVSNILRVLNNKFIKTIPEPAHSWEKGQMCSVQYHLDKNFCRGTVLGTTADGMVNVKLIDYGNEEECSHDELRSEALLIMIPVMCSEVQLADVFPKTPNHKWPTFILDTLHHLIVDKECDVTVVDATLNLPSVILTLNNTNVNKLVMSWDWNQTEPGLANNLLSNNDDDDSVIVEGEIDEDDAGADEEETRLLSTVNMSYQRIEIPREQQTFCAVVINILDYRTVMIEGDFVADILKTTEQEFTALLSDINAYANEQPQVSEIFEGMPCVALYSNDAQWYRAEIIFVDEAYLVKVLFVDYGNMEIVPIKNVRLCRKEWIDFPVQMLKCKISGIDKNNDCDTSTVCELLSDILLDKTFLVQVVAEEPELEVSFLDCETNELAYQMLLDDNTLINTP